MSGAVLKLCFLIKLPEASSSRSLPPTTAPPYRCSAICGPRLRVTRRTAAPRFPHPHPDTMAPQTRDSLLLALFSLNQSTEGATVKLQLLDKAHDTGTDTP